MLNRPGGGVVFSSGRWVRLAALGGAVAGLALVAARPVAAIAGPTEGTWVTKASMTVPRNGPATGVIAGKLYVATGSSTTALEVYDPLSDTWETRAPMSTIRAYAGAEVIDGKLYVVGGCINADCHSYTNALDVYDPATNTWTAKTSMPTARAGMVTGVLDGQLYVAGGFQDCGACVAIGTLESYDPVSNTWTTRAPMPLALAQGGGAVVGGKLHVVGGYAGGPTNVVASHEVYDPALSAWTSAAPMPAPRVYFGAGVANGILYAVSGYSDGSTPTSTVDAYDPATNTWTAVAPITTIRARTKPQGINGVLYVAGSAVSGSSSSLEAFYPAETVVASNVVAWGAGTTNTGTDPEYGQSIVPAGLSDVIGVAAGAAHTAVLKSDGTVVAWGADDEGQATVPAGLTEVKALSAGIWHTVALRKDGTVVAWGATTGGCFRNCGQSNVPEGLNGVTAIAAGGVHTLALKSDGTVVAWGGVGYSFGQETVPGTLSGVIAIGAGAYHSLAVKNDGTVVAWGWNGYGQTDVPAGLSDVEAVAGGYGFSAALKSDGTVVTWGVPLPNVPAALGGVIAIGANWDNMLALKSDGSVVAWGGNSYGLTDKTTGLPPLKAIAAGGYHNVGLVGTPGPLSCAAGTWSPNGLTSPSFCTPASLGHYVAGRGATSETPCPPGTDSLTTGATACVALPTISAAPTTSPNGAGWYNQNVTVHFTCTPGGSALPEGSCPADEVLTSEGLAVSSSARTVTADGGYVSAPSNVVVVKIDKTPPTLILPASITVDATSPAGAVVTYTRSATDALSGVVAVNCVLSSGSTFPIGTSTVACSATDEAGNTSSGSFQVLVQAAADQVANLAIMVENFNLAQGITNSLDAKLGNILSALSAAQTGSVANVCGQLNAFINEVQAQSGKKLTLAQANQLIAAATQIKAVVGCQ